MSEIDLSGGKGIVQRVRLSTGKLPKELCEEGGVPVWVDKYPPKNMPRLHTQKIAHKINLRYEIKRRVWSEHAFQIPTFHVNHTHTTPTQFQALFPLQ